MTEKEKMITELKGNIKGFYMQLDYLDALFYVQCDMQKFHDKLINAPEFSNIVDWSISDAATLILMRLYDKSENTMTIPNLIEKCKKNSHLFQSKKDEIEDNMNAFSREMESDCIQPIIARLKQYRDKFYAHNDKKFFGKKIVNYESNLKTYDLWILTLFTKKVLDYLSLQLDMGNDEVTKELYHGDLNQLFQNLN